MYDNLVPVSGNMVKSDGSVVNIADSVGGTNTGRKVNPAEYPPRSGTMIKSDGTVVNIADIIAKGIGGGSGGSGGGVSSWNDLTDKPFYEEKAVVFEQTVDCTNDMEGVHMGMVENPPFIPEDKTYDVTWNGTKYICNGIDLMGDGSVYALGNVEFFDGNTTEEPFLIAVENGILVFCVLESGIYDVKIEGITVKKIEEKFLPDMSKVTIVNGYYNKEDTADFNFDMSNDEMQEIAKSGGAVFASVLFEGTNTPAILKYDGYNTFYENDITVGDSYVVITTTKIVCRNDYWTLEEKRAQLTL